MHSFDLIIISKTFSYELTLDQSQNCVFLSLIGLWDKTAQLDYYLEDIKLALEKLSHEFNLIIDLTQYRGSNSDFLSLHIDALKLAVNAGLRKTAVILFDKPMVKVTIDYVFEKSGIKATYFSNRSSAEKWLTL